MKELGDWSWHLVLRCRGQERRDAPGGLIPLGGTDDPVQARGGQQPCATTRPGHAEGPAPTGPILKVYQNRESILAPAPTGAMERPAMEDLGVA